jgi:murein DD-endopeptidase MepM/ murein hydrolase activator NlpD
MMGGWGKIAVFVLALSAAGAAHAQDAGSIITPYLNCDQNAKQGGVIACRTEPFAKLALDGAPFGQADANGLAIMGLSRRQASPAMVTFAIADGEVVTDDRRYVFSSVDVATRSDTVSRFTMECGRITAQTPEQQRHAEVSWVKKDNALKSFNAPVASPAFSKPADGPYSSPFGVTRTYVPKTKDCEGSTSVHNGLDIAIPTGTEIRAPMGGTIILADADLFYEGGAVFLDHGRGLVSVMMHMSRIDVRAGDVVEQGASLGLSGATGRVTGPHLHWAIKYRNQLSNDRGTDIWLDPAILLELATTQQAAAGE